jgi:hypothetical protein
MLGKVGKARDGAKGASHFKDLVDYISREADGFGREVAKGEIGFLNMPGLNDIHDITPAIDLMDAVAEQARRKGKFRGDPVYHLILSWQEGEQPTPRQAAECVQYTLKALGMEECQAVWTIHRDTDNDHVHVAVNKIHPEKIIVAGPPYHDYFVIDKAMRELELIHGFNRDNGPYITLDTDEGPRIVRMSRSERIKRGLLKKGDEKGPQTTQAARAAERSQGAPSFQEWAQEKPAEALRDALNQPGATWQDLHDSLSPFGMVIQTKGSGMVVSTTLESGRVLACPISKLDRNMTKMKLEQRLGPFSPSLSTHPNTTDSYENFLRSVQSGKISDGPAPHNDAGGTRDKSRADRQKAREELHARYRADQQRIKDTRRDLRRNLLARQKAERDSLRQDHKARKSRYIAEQIATGTPRQIALSLWAFQAAREKEALQKQHLKQRHALPRTLVWRDWLERQAADPINDEAAKAALRGIRYRERKKENQQKNGIEGEELDTLKPFLSSLHHEIDRRRQLIHYRDEKGRNLFTDTGPRIEIHDRAESTVEAALRIAAQKYGAVDITGSSAFREQAARAAARLGIEVRDADLQQVWRMEREAMNPARKRAPQREEHSRER